MKSLTWIYLQGTLTTAGTTCSISNDNWGNVASFTGESVVLVSADEKTFEMAQASASAGTLTLTKRGLDNSDTKTEVSGNKLEWRAGTKVYITALASDIFDKDSSGAQAISGGINFSGTYNFSGILNSSATTTFDNLKIENKYTGPKFADTTARDVAYVSPTGGEICTVGGDLQYYNDATNQWETAASGTPTPNADTTTAGKIKIATSMTQTDVSGGVYSLPTNTLIRNYIASTSPVTDSSIPAGEDITAGYGVFIETGATTAQATVAQSIGSLTAYTRYALPVISSGVDATTFKLNLSKTSSPSVDLNFRLETDNAGSPSGTLVHANATAAVTAASLSGSLADTTVTWAGVFTAPAAGTICHLVMFQGTYGAETVNGTNYYNLGLSNLNTTTRKGKTYNGSTWALGSSITDALGMTFTKNSPADNTSRGVRILCNADCTLASVGVYTGTTPTRVRLFSDAGALLATGTFTGTTGSISYPLTSGVYYRIEADNSGSNFAYYYDDASFPYNKTDVSYISSSASEGTSTYSNFVGPIDSITTTGGQTTLSYISSGLFTDKLLSLTDTDYSYKSNLYGLSMETKVKGGFPRISLYGLNSVQTGLTAGSDYYLTGTPGTISTTPGSYRYKVGQALSSTIIQMDKQNLGSFSITTPASTTPYQNTTGKNIEIIITGGTVSKVEVSKDNSTYIQTAAATGTTVTLYPLDWVKVTWSGSPTMTGYYLA